MHNRRNMIAHRKRAAALLRRIELERMKNELRRSIPPLPPVPPDTPAKEKS